MNATSLVRLLCLGFIGLTLLPCAPLARAAEPPIDRHALVARHEVHVREIDPLSPLSVGNGDFAFTADVTGLQSFETDYHDKGIPLETLSTLPWAWHSFPNVDGLRPEDSSEDYPFHDRTIAFDSKQNSPAGAYFRENPHPMPLGQISFRYKGEKLAAKDLSNIDQRLDLWGGVIYSRFTLDGQPVTVETVAHPDRSVMAVKIASPLLKQGDLSVGVRFAYSYDFKVRNKPGLVWDKPELHQTKMLKNAADGVLLERSLDGSIYHVRIGWEGAARWAEEAPHQFGLKAADGAETLAFACAFSGAEDQAAPLNFDEVKTASARGWEQYWTKGGMADLSGSTDPRAAELERRIVLSQYLMKVNYAGSFPPQESGLTHMTWYGKHNSEVYFWHAAQFAVWGHTDLLEKGLAWYRKILPLAKEDAASKGFKGARWPKMVGIDGKPSPGSINPFIIWNFPTPIALSELVYRSRPERATLEQYRDLVFETADFLASYAYYDKATDRYILGPPIRSSSEKNAEKDTQNPTFELAYWSYGLKVAQAWRKRLGMEPEPHWADVLAKLSKLTVQDGKYVEIETMPKMYDAKGGVSSSMLMAYGFVPPTAAVDPAIMRNTFDEICRRNNGTARFVSWSMGEAAMTAARLGEPERAADIVTNAAPNAAFLNNGHVRRAKEPLACPAYLPVNGAFLAAVGMMAGGWDGAPKVNAPGFPRDGAWKVRAEGLQPMP